ncbi:MAG: flavin reductase family protein [Cyclobacteriaceae bacterium]|nr:flavin reductase family protein [Cyclobacteriaceae bacterium]
MTKTINPRELPVPQLHSLLLSAVAPRPIAFASTIDLNGEVNLSPFSFFNVFSANPPVMIFSPARRGRDNTIKHTLENVRSVPEVVINVVNHAMVEQMSLSSTEYPAHINEFTKSGLTEEPSQVVRPPRVKESPVSFECQVEKIIELGDQGGAGNLVISRVELIHVHEQFLDEQGKLDPTSLDQVARMGGNWYCRAAGDALFEIPKPLTTLGVGVDSLPLSVRNSAVLTGNNLGRLGNLERLPHKDEIDHISSLDQVKDILNKYPNHQDQLKELHRLAQYQLEQSQAADAMAILLWADRLP